MRPAFALAAFAAATLGATPAVAASVALVLAVDVSESVSADRYKLQHDGIARAFETPQLIDAIAAAPGGIEVLVVEWSDPDKIAVTVGWTRIVNRTGAASFASAVRATERTSRGLTAIGAALQAGAAAFEHMPEPASHKVIDVSGDGMANFGPAPGPVRDRLVAEGITINGLAILTEEPWLADYYKKNVIGGASSFCLVAESMDTFADAILKKLVQEIVGRPAHFAAVPPDVVPAKAGIHPPTARPIEKWGPALAGTTSSRLARQMQ
jgi:Ca-activated chloride channel homolog